MLCPKCKNATAVCDTRFDDKENEIFRRRVCKECGHDFYTVEFDIEATEKFSNMWKRLYRGSSNTYGKSKTK